MTASTASRFVDGRGTSVTRNSRNRGPSGTFPDFEVTRPRARSQGATPAARRDDARDLAQLKERVRARLPADATGRGSRRGSVLLRNARTGPEQEVMSISVAQSRTPSRAYAFRHRWKDRFQRRGKAALRAERQPFRGHKAVCLHDATNEIFRGLHLRPL